MASIFGDKDFISRLPNDCLISILSFLNPSSLDVIEYVNQKLRNLAIHKGWKRPKRAKNEIVIQQVQQRQVLLVTSQVNDYSLIWDPMIPMNFENKKSKFVYISGSLFNAIEEMSFKFAFQKLKLMEVHLDNSFSRNLQTTFHGDLPSSLELVRTTTSNTFNLIEFLIDTKIRTFSFYGAKTYEVSLFNEDFVRKFSGAGNTRLAIYRYFKESEYSWKPSTNLLPVICRYTTLHLEHMIMIKAILEELIPMAFKLVEKDVSWYFTMDSQLDENELANFNNGQFSMEKRTGCEVFAIKKKMCQKSCEITIGENNLLIIKFYSNLNSDALNKNIRALM
ncbi:hypothetical protein PRIPAC_73836 [Pristionchus pacificus]|uniref:F-box domain-containing protein n=1 Tax=Pristionchus pacificus TaxID=54126 RepID=A0A2A6BRK6_PRIPA|nr:hypothetical protein PRIPAC_73836 [Pristionchus pacificus]|eukprot:PDM68535.1 hypothetical protein PRIPAC_44037 [Pristionchus pacificus]